MEAESEDLIEIAGVILREMCRRNDEDSKCQ